MTARYTDADLWRLLYVSRTLDLDASVHERCRCRSERCRQPYTFLREDGSVGAVLSCSAGDAVVDALVDEGFGNREQPAGMELEFELIRRLDRAAERERQAEQPDSPEESLCFALARSIDLVTAGHPIEEVNRAGRALRGGTTP